MKTKKAPAKSRNGSNSSRQRAKIRAKRPVHRKILMHPAVLFILLATGVLLALQSLPSSADSYNVQAPVPAPALTSAAVITSPANGTHFSQKPINVSGTCPANSYVKLFRNNYFSGVALCAGGNFLIQSDLFPGANSLQARVFNVTDQEGPVSNIVTVYYDQPAASSQGPLIIVPFVIKSDYKYQGYYEGQKITWRLDISGGTPPYALTISWGDSVHTTLVRKDASSFEVSHSYAKKGDYIVKIEGADAASRSGFLQLIAIVNSRKSAVGLIGNTGSPLGTQNWLWLLWPSYLILLLMVLSFWFGERREYDLLMNGRRR